MTRARDMANIVSGNFNIPIGALGNAPNPIDAGTIVSWAKSTTPTGWLECDGSAVSRSTYADLFTAIGTTYGAGDGSSTFNLPDMRGRTAVGKDNMGGSAANRITNANTVDGTVLGQTGGAEVHTLSVSNIPSHSHAQRYWPHGSAVSLTYPGLPGHSGGGTSTSSTHDAATGGGGAHQNIQPLIVLNYIIKT